MKAKLLVSLRVNGTKIPLRAGQLVIVDLDDDEFLRLKELGSVTAPTKDELLIAGAAADRETEKPKRGGRKAAEKADGDTKVVEKVDGDSKPPATEL